MYWVCIDSNPFIKTLLLDFLSDLHAHVVERFLIILIHFDQIKAVGLPDRLTHLTRLKREDGALYGIGIITSALDDAEIAIFGRRGGVVGVLAGQLAEIRAGHNSACGDRRFSSWLRLQ